MIYTLHTFELALNCNSEIFYKLRNKSSSKDKHLLEQNEGLQIEYHSGTYKRKIKIIANPTILLGGDSTRKLWKPDDDNISKLLRKLEKRIGRYFDDLIELDDFKLTSVGYAVNFDVGDRKGVKEYLQCLKNTGRVKGFKPAKDNLTGTKNSYFLKGNSTWIEFIVYDKESESNSKEFKGILRAEIRLTKQAAIRDYVKDTTTSKQIKSLASNSRDIFLSVFAGIVPFGDYYKKADAIRLIKSYVPKKRTRDKMIKLIELIPKKKSLYLAIKTMNDRNIDKTIEAFRNLNLSPVTLSKRQDIKYLGTLYRYLLDD